MILTNYFLRKKINSLAGISRMREGYYRSFQEIRHILVFYDLRDREAIAGGLQSLRKLHKEVRGCVLVSSMPPCPSDADTPSGAGADSPKEDYPVSLAKSLNLWGFPSEAVRREIDALPADVLIDLTRRHCFPMQYLVWQHPSPFKAGPKRDGLDLYDLSILPADRDDISSLFEQILFYLRSIHAK